MHFIVRRPLFFLKKKEKMWCKIYQSLLLNGYRLNILSIRVFRFPVLRIYPLSWILASNCFINALHSRQIDQDSQRENSQSTAIPRLKAWKNLDSIFLIIIHCIRRFMKWAMINESISYLVSLTVTRGARVLFEIKITNRNRYVKIDIFSVCNLKCILIVSPFIVLV